MIAAMAQSAFSRLLLNVTTFDGKVQAGLILAGAQLLPDGRYWLW